MLEIKALEVSYGQAIAVAGASLSVRSGAWVCLIGPNGAGKTSLARAVVGLNPYRGGIIFDGEDLGALPAWDRQARGIGYAAEGRQTFPQMSVEENLRVGGYALPKPELLRAISDAYDLFPRLGERRGQAAGTMSGGEQQMLALARALMGRPKLLVVDEISWGIMPILTEQIFSQLGKLHQDGLTILQIEQNARDVLRRADHAYVMAGGQIAFEGPASALGNDTRLLESYVG
jgi:branched-chain amino acid transport system ATP-binding protein